MLGAGDVGLHARHIRLRLRVIEPHHGLSRGHRIALAHLDCDDASHHLCGKCGGLAGVNRADGAVRHWNLFELCLSNRQS